MIATQMQDLILQVWELQNMLKVASLILPEDNLPVSNGIYYKETIILLKSSLRKCQITNTTTTGEHLHTLQFPSRPANVSQGYLLPYLSMWESRLYCCFKTATKSCFILE